MTASEFAHIVTLADAATGGRVNRAADAPERAAIAARLGLVALDQFSMEAALRAIAGGIAATGKVHARVTQSCAATGMPVESAIDAPFDLHFVEEADAVPGAESDSEIEIEIDADDCERLPIDRGRADIGEAAVQTLALALDPYPRHADADRILAEKGVLSEEQAGPFAALAQLRDKPPR